MDNPFEDISIRLAKIESTLAQLVASFSMKENDKLLTIAEAAAYISLRPATIYGLVYRRLIPFIKKGKRLYFSKKELDKWLRSGEEANKSFLPCGFDTQVTGRRKVLRIG